MQLEEVIGAGAPRWTRVERFHRLRTTRPWRKTVHPAVIDIPPPPPPLRLERSNGGFVECSRSVSPLMCLASRLVSGSYIKQLVKAPRLGFSFYFKKENVRPGNTATSESGLKIETHRCGVTGNGWNDDGLCTVVRCSCCGGNFHLVYSSCNFVQLQYI